VDKTGNLRAVSSKNQRAENSNNSLQQLEKSKETMYDPN
jgi:hypothetical protein